MKKKVVVYIIAFVFFVFVALIAFEFVKGLFEKTNELINSIGSP